MPEQAFSIRVASFTNAVTSGVATGKTGEHLHIDIAIKKMLDVISDKGRKGSIYLIGNGGSAAVASHIANDLANMGSLRAYVLHDPALLTCLANDYGYEQIYSKQIQKFAKQTDLLIAISSSGQSKNILNAANAMAELGGTVFTLTGFDSHNPLREVGNFNYWIDSHDYGIVEIGHLFFLHHLTNLLQ